MAKLRLHITHHNLRILGRADGLDPDWLGRQVQGNSFALAMCLGHVLTVSDSVSGQ